MENTALSLLYLIFHSSDFPVTLYLALGDSGLQELYVLSRSV